MRTPWKRSDTARHFRKIRKIKKINNLKKITIMLVDTRDLRYVLIPMVSAEQNRNVRRGICEYAVDIINEMIEKIDWEYQGLVTTDWDGLERLALIGAKNWEQYSWGGCSLVTNYDIAMRLYEGEHANKMIAEYSGEWLLNEQARGLRRAWNMICRKMSSKKYWRALNEFDYSAVTD